jgi:hypothetical protein
MQPPSLHVMQSHAMGAQAEDVVLAGDAETGIEGVVLLESCLARGKLHFKLGNRTPALGPIIYEPGAGQGSNMSEGPLSPGAADCEEGLSLEQHLACAVEALTKAVAYQKKLQEEGQLELQMQSHIIVCADDKMIHKTHKILMR